MKSSFSGITDTGERIVPPAADEVSLVFSRHRFAYEYAAHFVQNGAVLDAGCGTGYGCAHLSGPARLVCGIDASNEALRYCRETFSRPGVHYVRMDAAKLGLKKCFDTTISFQVIEHIENVIEYLEELKRVTREGGKIFISTPNVPPDRRPPRENPFHAADYDYIRFSSLIGRVFTDYEILGVDYASRNPVRTFIRKIPFYHWSRHILTRRSAAKKMISRALDLTTFRVTATAVERSLDLLAVCRNG